MSSEINLTQKTQRIIVEPSSKSVSIINAGPIGPAGPSGEVKVYFGDAPPVSPEDGRLWVDSDSMILYGRYNDGDSVQWVELGSFDSFVSVGNSGATASVFLVDEYGDVSGDATSAIQAAITAAETNGSGVVKFGSKTYRIEGNLSVDCREGRIIDIDARGAILEFDGSGVGLTITDTELSEYNRGVHILGGMWVGTTNGVFGNGGLSTIIRVQDIVFCTMVGVWITGVTAGTCLEVRNLNYWTEQTTLLGCKLTHSARAIDFVPASVSGGAGTESFARFRASGCVFSGGATGGYLVNLSGDVYASSFTDCGGNVNPGANVYYINGAHLGTTIMNQDFEGGNSSSRVFTVGPNIGANYPRISNVRVDNVNGMQLTNNTLISDAHTFEGDIYQANNKAFSWRNAADSGYVEAIRVNGSNVVQLAAAQSPLQVGASGGEVGFYGASPGTKRTISGARNNPEAALADLLTKLAEIGLITNSTTAT